jgi:hypothetical protein
MLNYPARAVLSEETAMLRAFALSLILLAGPAVAADAVPARSPLACDWSQPGEMSAALCGLPQLAAAANCGQTCYDDQNACHAACDRTYRGGVPGHDKCIASCGTTYGRCQTRCNAPQKSRRPSE